MPALRPLLTLVLALCLALTAAHTAVTRAEARGAQMLVICSGGAARLVLLDATGKPVAPHAACPDCVLGGMAVEGPLTALPPAALGQGERIAEAPERDTPGLDPSEPQARGPPAA